ncbi:MAG: hydantoinase B/oxoprolinase family protein, partial [Burkholderiales bacterium]
ALPDVIPAAHLGTLGGSMTFFGRDPRNGRDFILQTIEGGGWGGRPYEDGMSATVSVCQGDVRNAPIETVELKSPVLVRRRALRSGSGGAGKFRGGLGQITEMTSLCEGRWSASNAGRRLCPPWGIAGGAPGEASRNLMRLPDEGEFRLHDPVRALSPPMTSVRIETAGGGGWGAPHERDIEQVVADVLDDIISVEQALQDYGVVIDPGTMTPDAEATRAARNRLRVSHAAQP